MNERICPASGSICENISSVQCQASEEQDSLSSLGVTDIEVVVRCRGERPAVTAFFLGRCGAGIEYEGLDPAAITLAN